MAYNKTTWEDLPSTNTPLSAANLNKIENELAKLDNVISSELTINSNYFSTIDVNSVQRIGNVVFVDFRGLISTNLPGSTTGLIVTPYHPTLGSNQTMIAFTGDRYIPNALTWFYFQGYSLITNAANVSAGKWLHIHYSYITDN